jgi:hypothetical protein
VIIPTNTNAEYTLVGDPDNCGNPVVGGTYIEGQGLNNSNTVDVAVEVTQTGDYALVTDKVNGIYFSSTGTFTDVGSHSVRLVGSGTPDVPGIFSFTLAGGSTHCTFDLPVRNRDPVATYVLESGSGSPNPCIATVAGTYHSQTPLSVSNSISMSVYVTVPGNYTIQTNKVNGMVFSASGTFTNLNQQYITLVGSGTPLSPGSFTLTPQIVGPHPLGGQACSVNINVQ